MECLCEKSAVIWDRNSLRLHFFEELSVGCRVPRTGLKQQAKAVTQHIRRGSWAEWQCPSVRSLVAWSSSSECWMGSKKRGLEKL